MLELERVTNRFAGGVTAVNDLSLSLSGGGVLGLLGPNGAGKTTLMQMIATITAPTSGTIRFDGVDLAADPDHLRRRLGYLPQDFGVYDNLTALEFLTYFASLKGVIREQWQNFTDILGMRFMLQQVRGGQELQGLSIGQSSFDPSKAPWIFDGVHWTWPVVEARAATALLALPLLLLALAFFARFDPARIKGGTAEARVSALGKINGWLKPLTRVLLPLTGRGGGLGGIALGEFTLTLILSPLALVWWVGLSASALLANRSSLMEAVLPVMFVAITAIVADIATRDSSAGTTALLYGLPRVRRAFVATKFLGAALTALAFLIVPMLRLGLGDPQTALSLAIEGLLVSAAAVALGRLTGSSKAFTGVFLLFLYVVLSSKGNPGLDFAGWNGVETAGVRLGYLLVAVVLLALAMLRHHAQTRRS